jgi:hypothetical protein
MKKMKSTMKAPETDALVGLNYPSTSTRFLESRTHVVDLVHGSLETRERSTEYSTSKRKNWFFIVSQGQEVFARIRTSPNHKIIAHMSLFVELIDSGLTVGR